MAETFDPYHQWLGIHPSERPITLYRLLGLQPFEENLTVIENSLEQRMAHVRSKQSGEQQQAATQLLNVLSRARITLLNAENKAQYDTQLRQKLAVPTSPMSPPVATSSGDAPIAPFPGSPTGSPVVGSPVVGSPAATSSAPPAGITTAATKAKPSSGSNRLLPLALAGGGLAAVLLIGLGLLVYAMMPSGDRNTVAQADGETNSQDAAASSDVESQGGQGNPDSQTPANQNSATDTQNPPTHNDPTHNDPTYNDPPNVTISGEQTGSREQTGTSQPNQTVGSGNNTGGVNPTSPQPGQGGEASPVAGVDRAWHFYPSSRLALRGKKVDFKGEFTIEMWVRNVSPTPANIVVSSRLPKFQVRLEPKIDIEGLFAGNSETFSFRCPNPFSWYHLAIAGDGTNVRMFVNGAGPSLIAQDLNFDADVFPESWLEFGGSEFELASVRLSTSCRYKSSFVPPTSFAVDADTLTTLRPGTSGGVISKGEDQQPRAENLKVAFMRAEGFEQAAFQRVGSRETKNSTLDLAVSTRDARYFRTSSTRVSALGVPETELTNSYSAQFDIWPGLKNGPYFLTIPIPSEGLCVSMVFNMKNEDGYVSGLIMNKEGQPAEQISINHLTRGEKFTKGGSIHVTVNDAMFRVYTLENDLRTANMTALTVPLEELREFSLAKDSGRGLTFATNKVAADVRFVGWLPIQRIATPADKWQPTELASNSNSGENSSQGGNLGASSSTPPRQLSDLTGTSVGRRPSQILAFDPTKEIGEASPEFMTTVTSGIAGGGINSSVGGSVAVALPDQSTRDTSVASVREVFTDELKERDSEKLTKTYYKLLSLSDETGSTDDRFGLLQVAAEVAAQSGDGDLVIDIVDKLNQQYQIPSYWDMLLANLKTASRNIPSEEKRIAFTYALIEQSQLAAENFNYVAADAFADLAASVGFKCRDAQLKKVAREWKKDAAVLLANWEKAEQAIDTCSGDPTQTVAAQSAGEFFLNMRHFPAAVYYLNRSNHPQFKALAAAELTNPSDIDQQVALADRWFAVGESQTDESLKNAALARALQWYEHLQGKATGLTKARVESRLEELAGVPLSAFKKIENLAANALEKAGLIGMVTLQNGGRAPFLLNSSVSSGGITNLLQAKGLFPQVGVSWVPMIIELEGNVRISEKGFYDFRMAPTSKDNLVVLRINGRQVFVSGRSTSENVARVPLDPGLYRIRYYVEAPKSTMLSFAILKSDNPLESIPFGVSEREVEAVNKSFAQKMD